MKRPRPNIPDSVKCDVAFRQLFKIALERGANPIIGVLMRDSGETLAHLRERRLAILVNELGCKREDLRLDHDPPLRARKFNPRTGRYTPAANDPRFLVYRSHADHQRKTYLRGDGAQFSDTVLIKRERRREKRENGTARPKAKIPQRANPWPKGRKLQGRGFRPRTT